MVFGDSVLHNLVVARPTTLSELHTVSGIGPEKADRYGADIIAICRSETPPMISPAPSKKSSSRPERSGVERPAHFALSSTNEIRTETFTRPRPPAHEPAETLTPEQQALDHRLREWRQAESEKLNLPLFFVLASTTLRSIVLTRPQDLIATKNHPRSRPRKNRKVRREHRRNLHHIARPQELNHYSFHPALC